jgi:outer membrane protein TolC
MKKSVILLCIALSSFALSAQETISLSLKEAQDYAIQNNKTLQNARDDILLAQSRVRQAISQGLPQVNGTFNYMTNFNYEAQLNFGGGEGSVPDINMSLLDAGDLEIMKLLSSLTSAAGPAVIVMEDQANATVQLSQLIFSGQYWMGIQMSKLAKKLSEQSVDMTELDIREGVTGTYYLILISERSLDIVRQNIENLNDVMKHTTDMYNAGVLESTDVDQIRINLSQLENASNSLERNVELSYNIMRLQLGLDPGVPVRLSDTYESLLPDLEKDDILLHEFNLKENPAFQLMETQTLMSEKNVSLNKWSFAPTVAGYYSYTEKILTTGFDISPKNAAGLTVSLPIFTGGKRNSQITEARIELQKAERNKSLLADQLTMQQNQLLFEYNNAMENYLTQKENVEVAKRVYNSNYNKYNQGLLSSLNLTQANSNYLQAETNYVSSVMNLLQAKLALQKLYNTLE